MPVTLGKLAIIAGERSGDLLAGDLVRALSQHLGRTPELVGVGGPELEAQGLKSLFDYSELSIIGIAGVLAKLPKLIGRIRQAADAIIAQRPDCLVIVDSPDFTHRVARKVRKALPDLLIVNYVCPTVWAWKPGRARTMRAYVDHVLSIFPFEAEIVSALGGPPLTYVGHRLMADPGLLAAHEMQRHRRQHSTEQDSGAGERLCLLLPGSRRGEIGRLADPLGDSARRLRELDTGMRFIVPAAHGREKMVHDLLSGWQQPYEIVTGENAKWDAFGQADVAIAASGTVLLELALAGVPHISLYKIDPLAHLVKHLVTTWTAALPNHIAGDVVVQEYINDMVRPERIARHALQLASPGPHRTAALADFELIYERMRTDRPASEIAAETIINLLK